MKIKNLIVGLGLLLVACGAKAAAMPVRIQSYTAVGTATTVSISTSAWTKVPTTSSLTGRTEVCVDLPASASAGMVGIISSNSSTPAEAITVRPIEIVKGEQDRCYDVPDGLYLYLLSLHTGAENAHVQERRR
jgi:hypothetical protein